MFVGSLGGLAMAAVFAVAILVPVPAAAQPIPLPPQPSPPGSPPSIPGPAPGDPQPAPDVKADFQKKLIGNWYFEGMTGPDGYQAWTTIRIEYLANNTYRGVISQEMPGLPPSQSALSGRYSIQPVSSDSFLLTHISPYRQDQAEYKFVDDNTLLNLSTNGTSRRVS